MSELYQQLGELSNLSASNTASTTASASSIRSNYGRSLSLAASGPGGRKYSTPPGLMMHRRDTTPGIVEFPGSPTPVDLDANGKNFKVEKILKGSLDLITSPSEKIRIMGRKVCLRCEDKTLLGVVNKF